MTSLQKWGKSVRTTIPVMAGYLVLGAGFGILLRTRGYGLGWALAMSAFIYAGSMQYVAIDLLTGGASLLTTAVTTLLVNARHLFYGISMLERYRAAGKYAPYLIFSLTDETYSLVAAREDLTGAECFRISLLDQLYSAGRSARLRARIWTLIRPASTFRSRRSFSRCSPSSGWRRRITPRRSSVSAFRSSAVFCSARTASCCRQWAACSAAFWCSTHAGRRRAARAYEYARRFAHRGLRARHGAHPLRAVSCIPRRP